MQAENSQAELLRLNTQSEEQNTANNKSSQIVNKHHIEGTGFDIIGDDEHGYFVALGSYKITTNSPTLEYWKGAIHGLRDIQWEIIIGMIGAVIQANEDAKKAQEIHEKQTTKEAAKQIKNNE